ncbi:hypothetical protein PMI34_01669 [Pseudomonas sp. GM74]|uniref:hypothetical protein n=1 Tax=Pseudomonas sp. GM74 TaxID=1144336 RepID=UPI000270CA24|nr:hypothetical protein [Pseudomonas sp. GM74]EJM93516.1 hypothetical protein PMI34_01669 [Pseudomonas sp. GM74]
MEDVIRRVVDRQYPELTGGYHLPRFARVVAIPDPPTNAGLCDDFRPRFAADLEVLGPDGEPDTALPLLQGVPLPLPIGGESMGIYGLPDEGTMVVVSFAYGLPHKPFVLAILPQGLSLPNLPKGDQVWQHSEAVQQRVDADGNWLRQTDGQIHDQASERRVEALENTEHYQRHSVTVDDHSIESVGGIKKIEALGSLKLLSGGSASLAAVDDLHQATGRDLNLVVGQKLNASVGGDMEERIAGLRRSVAEKTWMGSEGVNVLQVLCDLLDLVTAMSTQLAGHTHVPGPEPSPSDAEAFTDNAAQAIALVGQLKPITL